MIEILLRHERLPTENISFRPIVSCAKAILFSSLRNTQTLESRRPKSGCNLPVSIASLLSRMQATPKGRSRMPRMFLSQNDTREISVPLGFTGSRMIAWLSRCRIPTAVSSSLCLVQGLHRCTRWQEIIHWPSIPSTGCTITGSSNLDQEASQNIPLGAGDPAPLVLSMDCITFAICRL